MHGKTDTQTRSQEAVTRVEVPYHDLPALYTVGEYSVNLFLRGCTEEERSFVDSLLPLLNRYRRLLSEVYAEPGLSLDAPVLLELSAAERVAMSRAVQIYAHIAQVIAVPVVPYRSSAEVIAYVNAFLHRFPLSEDQEPEATICTNHDRTVAVPSLSGVTTRQLVVQALRNELGERADTEILIEHIWDLWDTYDLLKKQVGEARADLIVHA